MALAVGIVHILCTQMGKTVEEQVWGETQEFSLNIWIRTAVRHPRGAGEKAVGSGDQGKAQARDIDLGVGSPGL